MKKDPEATLERIAFQEPLRKDVWIYRMVVIFIGLAIVIPIFCATYLEISGKKFPESLMALPAVAVGALGGLLAPSPLRNKE